MSFGRKHESRSILSSDTVITGDIRSRGILEVRGRIEGDVEHAGTLIIGRDGECLGSVAAEHLRLEGTVHGNVYVEGDIEIESGGRLEGDFRCARLRVSSGAVCNGRATMGSGASSPAAAAIAPPIPHPAAPASEDEDFALQPSEDVERMVAEREFDLVWNWSEMEPAADSGDASEELNDATDEAAEILAEAMHQTTEDVESAPDPVQTDAESAEAEDAREAEEVAEGTDGSGASVVFHGSIAQSKSAAAKRAAAEQSESVKE